MAYDLSCYHPSIGEEILIERPFDSDCFRAKVTSVTGEPGDYPIDVTVGFERLDGVSDLNPTCNIADITWTNDPAKDMAFREYQSRLLAWRDSNDRI